MIKTFSLIAIFFLLGAITTYLVLNSHTHSNINSPILYNGSVYIISPIPPKISYLKFQKIIDISNTSYGYDKKYYQTFNGIIPSLSNFTNVSAENLYDNITIENIRFGFYTIKVIVNETLYAGPGHEQSFNYTRIYKLYLGNGTVIWT
jgi:hypothetical protein